MKARIEKIDPGEPDAAVLDHAAKLIRRGQVVVCPTDTGYAFSANALDTRAIGRVFQLKGRSFSNPIHVAVHDIEAADTYACLDDAGRYLAAHYLPGALTLVMKKRETIPSMLVAGMETIGIRIPANQAILRLAEMTGMPITTTSANVSGKPGTYAVQEIEEQLGDDIEGVAMLLDQGTIPGREVSTIVDISGWPPQLIRQGRVSWLELRESLKRFEPVEDTNTTEEEAQP